MDAKKKKIFTITFICLIAISAIVIAIGNSELRYMLNEESYLYLIYINLFTIVNWLILPILVIGIVVWLIFFIGRKEKEINKKIEKKIKKK